MDSVFNMISSFSSLSFLGGAGKSGEPVAEISEEGRNEDIQAEKSLVALAEPKVKREVVVQCQSDSISSMGSTESFDLDFDNDFLPPEVENEVVKFQNVSTLGLDNGNERERKLFRKGYKLLERQEWTGPDESMRIINSFDDYGSTTDSSSTASSSSGSVRNPFRLPPGVPQRNRPPLSALPKVSPHSEVMRDRIIAYQKNKFQNEGRQYRSRDTLSEVQNEWTGYGGSMPLIEDKKEFDLSWTPKPVRNLPDEVEAEYEEWDPMAENHFSTKNIRCFDAISTLQGIPHFRGAICPHTRGSDCYKKRRCFFEHHIDQDILEANPKMAIPLEPTPITHFTQMASKKLGRAGIYFKARVTYVRNINEFYVVPVESIKCECIVRRTTGTKKSTKPRKVLTVESITKSLEAHFRNYGQKYASSYSVMQLVAIEGEWNGLKGYFRAAMIEEAIVEADEFSEAAVYCFDIGRLIKVRMDKLSMLPKAFSAVPPLAYRCSLYGMRYTTMYETKEATDFFADTVLQAKDLIVHVKVPFEPDLPGEVNSGVVEEEPYLVELFTVEEDGFKELKNVLKSTHNFIEMDPPERNIATYVPRRHEPCDHGSPRQYVEEITGLPPKCNPI